MDQLMEYRKVLMRLMQKHSDLLNNSATANVQTHTIFDEARDQYMLFRAGWQNKQRIHLPLLYVRLAGDKLWIEEDYTEDGIATELAAAGIPKAMIVLGFRHPDMRPLTEFAVA